MLLYDTDEVQDQDPAFTQLTTPLGAFDNLRLVDRRINALKTKVLGPSFKPFAVGPNYKLSWTRVETANTRDYLARTKNPAISTAYQTGRFLDGCESLGGIISTLETWFPTFIGRIWDEAQAAVSQALANDLGFFKGEDIVGVSEQGNDMTELGDDMTASVTRRGRK